MMLIKILTSQAHLLMMILGHEIEGELICGKKNDNFVRHSLKCIGKRSSGFLKASK